MDSLEVNKIVGAVLGTSLFAMGLGVLADIVFYRPPPAKPGYAVEVAEAKPHGDAGAPAAAAAEPIAVRLAKADPARGETAFKACVACHTADKGAGAKIGPNLWGVVSRDIASMPGFAYSPAMSAHEGDWTYERLDQFLTKPTASIPGTKMNFPGIAKPDVRADVIAYLRSRADNPAPLP